jgi:SAM-dependent methyltransferase
MYDALYDLFRRPEPFSRYTVKELWTRPHLARQMLNYHLNQDTELASRPVEKIDRVVGWIDEQLDLSGKRVCDLGCGPGLYTQRFADRGAEVSGVDFSAHSLDYAKAQAQSPICYLEADYLSDELPEGFDIVTLIYCDFCSLSPVQRTTLLGRVRQMLNPGGHFVLDVFGMGSFALREETTVLENRMMGGFWAATDYVGIQRSLVYPKERLTLDRYLIVEPEEAWQIFNWLQYFTPQSIEEELSGTGFEVDLMSGGLSGEPMKTDGDFIGIIANRA